jgi:hypothetical protein
MKTNKAMRLFLAFFVVILYGCPNEGPYHMYTQIMPDGSCRRELIRSADSAFVINGDTAYNPFPMKLDSTWKLTYYKRSEGDSSRFANWPVNKVYKSDSGEFSWFVTAEKNYASVTSMAESFQYDNSNWSSLKHSIDFRKKFRWFYTYYEFAETYPASNQFHIIPISEYLTKAEVDALYGEDKELYRGKNGFEILNELKGINEKADKWLEHNLYEEFYLVFLENYNRFKNAPVDSQEFAMEKDTIFKYYIITDSADFSEIDDMLNHHFHTEAYTVDDELDSLLEAKLGYIFEFDEIQLNYNLSIPGKVIETNAPFMSNDTLSWKVENNRFYFDNYTLMATSRRPNYWAFIATAIIVLAALAGFMVKKKPAL